jgi:hypothetical protein
MKVSMQTPVPIPEPRGTAIDVISEDDVKVEIVPETGFKDKYKLYVHGPDAHTIVRICKLRSEDIELNMGLALEKRLQQDEPPGAYKFVDFGKLEQQMKDAIGNIPQYRRMAIWNYVEALRNEIAYLQQQQREYGKHKYDRGVEDGMSRAGSRPGDGDMGG